jgi:hypothetical protein
VVPTAYSELWERLVARIVADQAPIYVALGSERASRCGDRLDTKPRIGQTWQEFRSCQSSYYELQARVMIPEGWSSVFMRPEDDSRVYVTNGEIVRWERRDPLPAVGAGPPPYE